MPAKKKSKSSTHVEHEGSMDRDELAIMLHEEMNKKGKVSYFLDEDNPAEVVEWVSTGSTLWTYGRCCPPNFPSPAPCPPPVSRSNVSKPIVRELLGKTFFIGHGDGLGPGDHGYKFIKKVFANPVCQWLFARLHPNLGIGLANFWSQKSRESNKMEKEFYGPEKERLLVYANRKLDEQAADFYVFGHRHLPIDYTLKDGKSRYINLGEWMNYNSYAVFDGENVEIKFFENEGATYFKF